MKHNMLFLLLLVCPAFIYSTTANEPVKKILEDFTSEDWPTVLLAKEKLENIGIACIDEIMPLMNNCRIVELQNTDDLIYPGAEHFFGHGQIIDYNIDDICVRAGWLLEELTLKNFGFTGIHLHKNELLNFIKTTFPDYYRNPDNQKHANRLSESEKRKLIRSLAIEQAKEWWQTESKQWNRLTALEQALNSPDEKCQVKALFYMRNGKTLCKGLTEEFYKTRLEDVITRLSNSKTKRVSENAKLILLDSDFDWLSIKPVN